MTNERLAELKVYCQHPDFWPEPMDGLDAEAALAMYGAFLDKAITTHEALLERYNALWEAARLGSAYYVTEKDNPILFGGFFNFAAWKALQAELAKREAK